MKKALQVAKNELKSLFYSPIAWIVMVVFLYMTSSYFFELMESYAGVFERGGPGLEMCDYLTGTITTGEYGLLSNVTSNLYLFFPLMTMGLISREVNNGTVKLLYSSPLRIREIVMGKFLAIVTFTIALLLLVGLTYINMAVNMRHVDYGQLAASTVALLLLFSTYAAIGLFISSLTSYQIVAAIVTFAVLSLLGSAGKYLQEVAIVRDITFYMNLNSKADGLLSGLFNLRDVCYFLVLIFSFLSFTVLRLRSGMESISRSRKTGRYSLVIVIAFFVGYVTSNPRVNLYWDTTRDERLTITPRTQETLAALKDSDLEVTMYTNLFHQFHRSAPAVQNKVISSLWEPYIRFKPNIHIKFVYYYGLDTSDYRFKNNPGKTIEQIAEKDAKSRQVPLKTFLDPGQAGKLADIQAEEYRSFFVLRYKGRETVLRVFDDPTYWPSENEMAAAIKRLKGNVPKIGFLSDEIERSGYLDRKRDYKAMTRQLGNRHSLINQGYDFDSLSLQGKEIPADLAGLAICDPRVPFSAGSREKINRWIDEGHNLFITCEPDRKEVLQPILDKCGITLGKGLLLQTNKEESSDVVFGEMTNAARELSPQFSRFISDEIIYRGDTTFRVSLTGTCPMETRDAGFRVVPLLYTNRRDCWNRLAPISDDSLQLKVNRLPTDEQGPFLTCVKLERNIHNRQQRIVVTSDADYLSGTGMRGRKPQRYNYLFGFWCFSQYSYGQFPANTLKPKSIDDGFTHTAEQISGQKIIYLLILPAILAIIGAVVLIRRKRK